jgi:hypothetical protein
MVSFQPSKDPSPHSRNETELEVVSKKLFDLSEVESDRREAEG